MLKLTFETKCYITSQLRTKIKLKAQDWQMCQSQRIKCILVIMTLITDEFAGSFR